MAGGKTAGCAKAGCGECKHQSVQASSSVLSSAVRSKCCVATCAVDVVTRACFSGTRRAFCGCHADFFSQASTGKPSARSSCSSASANLPGNLGEYKEMDTRRPSVGSTSCSQEGSKRSQACRVQ
eukprot:2790216-Amphidinium_carterae.3